MRMSIPGAAVLALLLVTPEATLGQAQPNAEGAPSDWRVECTNTGTALDCSAVHRLLQREDGRILVALSIRRPPDARQAVMLIQMPLGIVVNEPVKLTVDNGPEVSFPIQTCTAAGCFVGAQIPSKLLDGMRKGRTLLVSFTDLQRQAVNLPMSLSGFTIAYEKIK